ncbi:sigma-70 family RNA polymerase sigma factor [Kitasatospora sp. NPDC059327]|uniref:sigma-70 family RNA polymerase sigma factor n=1 Tax=Kitasatospora sp. NPDC059327 TaxID=3346803 RepID=UPI0036C559B3
MTLQTGPRLLDPSPARPRVPADELADLMIAAARGDQDSFARLYVALAGPVYGIALRTLRSPSHAEEVAQEVLIEVWRTAASYRPERGSVLAWALTIAHRRAVDRVRSVRAATERDQRVTREEPGGPPSVVDEVERMLEGARVRTALAALSGAQRESVVLAYYGGYSQRQIARIVGVPLGTVKTRIRDGLIRLRAVYGSETG